MKDQLIHIPAGNVVLEGNLEVPTPARATVLFAHGSGSSRHSLRNRFVARQMRQVGLGTLLLDLLTVKEEAEEQHTGHHRFNIALLADRLLAATAWLNRNPETQECPVGYFGASTGAGAALVAAARLPESVGAIVARGGRPDLAGLALARVRTPTLLLVGELDPVVINLNRLALAQLAGEKELLIVPRASHLFEEPGTLEEVARQAADWFKRYLRPAGLDGL